MDLLMRSAGFGYISSTRTSLIYATFTFIFFALEPRGGPEPELLGRLRLCVFRLRFGGGGLRALFVKISQLKINVTNAYAGALAWSNFFSRLTHSHPGRVVWVVFNTLIAFMLTEMNVLQALGDVLGLYSNIAIAWVMAVVADLVINKPLGLSPPGIEFKRAHLHDINPVGVGAMALASLLSVTAHLGLYGEMAQAFSAVIAMATAFVTAPLIAWATKGRYYIARRPTAVCGQGEQGACTPHATQKCVICERAYEGPDMAHCPAYQGAICSLCCTLDARCGGLCKPPDRAAPPVGQARRAAPDIPAAPAY